MNIVIHLLYCYNFFRIKQNERLGEEMEKNDHKRYQKYIHKCMKSVDATESQLEFLINQYSDDRSVVGIHNTIWDYESFFSKGLRNQTSMYSNSCELANTVYYSESLISLAMYPNGDGKKRQETAIILKIPKSVFTHEQGIFEALPDGSYGIPSQFIVGAFVNGEVMENPNFQKEYNNPNAVKCNDPDYVTKEKNQDFQIEIFKKEYQRKKSSIKNRLATIIDNLKSRKKQACLPPAEVNTEDNENAHQKYVDGLKKNFGDMQEFKDDVKHKHEESIVEEKGDTGISER